MHEGGSIYTGRNEAAAGAASKEPGSACVRYNRLGGRESVDRPGDNNVSLQEALDKTCHKDEAKNTPGA